MSHDVVEGESDGVLDGPTVAGGWSLGVADGSGREEGVSDKTPDGPCSK